MHLLVDEVRGPLAGRLDVPRSKYHAHRALILASLARGTTRIVGASGARHVGSTIEVLRALGTEIELDGDGFVVHGGPYRPYPPVGLGRQLGHDPVLHDRAGRAGRPPVHAHRPEVLPAPAGGRAAGALTRLGVRLHADEARPPITVSPSRPAGGHVRIAGTLSQWISGLLLVAPFATGRTVVEVDGVLNEQPYVELTVRMMRQFGLEVDVADDWRRFEIEPGQEARPDDRRAAAGHRLGRVRARRDRAASQRRAVRRPDRDAGGGGRPPRGPFPRRRRAHGAADGGRGRRRARPPRRHRPARHRRRLPADARHAADPGHARGVRRRARPGSTTSATCASRNPTASSRWSSSTAWAARSSSKATSSSCAASPTWRARRCRPSTTTAS